MQYWECQCGSNQYFGSGMIPPRCNRCNKCGTNCYKEPPQPHDYYQEHVETDNGPQPLSRCRMCYKTKAYIEKFGRKPILGLDFGNTIKIIGVDSLTFGFAEAIPKLKELFGTDIYIVSRVNDLAVGEAKVREFMTKYGLFDLIPSDHLNFCLLRNEKAAICDKLGVTHFVDDRTECLHYMDSVPFKYALNPTQRQLDDFPLVGMKTVAKRVNDWFDCINGIDKDIE